MDELGIILCEVVDTLKNVGIILALIFSVIHFIHFLFHWREFLYGEFTPYWEKEEKKAEKKRLKAEKKARIEAQRWWTE